MRIGIDCEKTWSPHNQEGRGTVGCIVSLVLLGAAVLVGIEFIPIYYSHKSLETDVKTEVSRAGANFYGDENLQNNIVFLARRNEIKLTRENVRVERFAGQIHVTILYRVPVDLIFYSRDMEFRIKASSFVGRL